MKIDEKSMLKSNMVSESSHKEIIIYIYKKHHKCFSKITVRIINSDK